MMYNPLAKSHISVLQLFMDKDNGAIYDLNVTWITTQNLTYWVGYGLYGICIRFVSPVPANRDIQSPTKIKTVISP